MCWGDHIRRWIGRGSKECPALPAIPFPHWLVSWLLLSCLNRWYHCRSPSSSLHLKACLPPFEQSGRGRSEEEQKRRARVETLEDGKGLWKVNRKIATLHSILHAHLHAICIPWGLKGVWCTIVEGCCLRHWEGGRVEPGLYPAIY